MNDPIEISDGLSRHLFENITGGLTVVLENSDKIPDRPYLFCEITPVSSTDETLDGTGATDDGFFVVTVVSESGQFLNPGLEIAKEVRALFTYGRRFPLTKAEMTIMKPPDIEKGFRDGFDWRIPVRVTYQACRNEL